MSSNVKNTPASPTPAAQTAVLPDFGNMKNYWERLLNNRKTSSDREIVNIKVINKTIDPLMNEALIRAYAHLSKTATEEAMIKLINEKGWSSEIDKVTKRLNKMRITDTKKRILDISYVYILNELLNEKTPNSFVKDELGLTDAILYQLEKENGPLDVVAEFIVDMVAKKNRIDLQPNTIMSGLMVQQLRSHF